MIKKTIKWTFKARVRIKESAKYIKKDNPLIADKFVKQVKQRAQILIDFPNVGVEGRVLGARELKVSNFPYCIVYIPKDTLIEIVDVVPDKMQYPYKT